MRCSCPLTYNPLSWASHPISALRHVERKIADVQWQASELVRTCHKNSRKTLLKLDDSLHRWIRPFSGYQAVFAWPLGMTARLGVAALRGLELLAALSVWHGGRLLFVTVSTPIYTIRRALEILRDVSRASGGRLYNVVRLPTNYLLRILFKMRPLPAYQSQNDCVGLYFLRRRSLKNALAVAHALPFAEALQEYKRIRQHHPHHGLETFKHLSARLKERTSNIQHPDVHKLFDWLCDLDRAHKPKIARMIAELLIRLTEVHGEPAVKEFYKANRATWDYYLETPFELLLDTAHALPVAEALEEYLALLNRRLETSEHLALTKRVCAHIQREPDTALASPASKTLLSRLIQDRPSSPEACRPLFEFLAQHPQFVNLLERGAAGEFIDWLQVPEPNTPAFERFLQFIQHGLTVQSKRAAAAFSALIFGVPIGKLADILPCYMPSGKHREVVQAALLHGKVKADRAALVQVGLEYAEKLLTDFSHQSDGNFVELCLLYARLKSLAPAHTPISIKEHVTRYNALIKNLPPLDAERIQGCLDQSTSKEELLAALFQYFGEMSQDATKKAVWEPLLQQCLFATEPNHFIGQYLSLDQLKNCFTRPEVEPLRLGVSRYFIQVATQKMLQNSDYKVYTNTVEILLQLGSVSAPEGVFEAYNAAVEKLHPGHGVKAISFSKAVDQNTEHNKQSADHRNGIGNGHNPVAEKNSVNQPA